MVSILGLNEAGYESANEAMCEGKDLPWLQDTPDVDVWTGWSIEYRDVVVLDAQGEHLFTFNLTERDLNDPVEYEALGDQLRDAAAAAE